MTTIRSSGLRITYLGNHVWRGYSPSTERDFSAKLMPGKARWVLDPHHPDDDRNHYTTLPDAIRELLRREADLDNPQKLFFYKPRESRDTALVEKTTLHEITIRLRAGFYVVYFRKERIFAYPRIDTARLAACHLLSTYVRRGMAAAKIQYPLPLNPITSDLILQEPLLITPVKLDEDPSYDTIYYLTRPERRNPTGGIERPL